VVSEDVARSLDRHCIAIRGHATATRIVRWPKRSHQHRFRPVGSPSVRDWRVLGPDIRLRRSLRLVTITVSRSSLKTSVSVKRQGRPFVESGGRCEVPTVRCRPTAMAADLQQPSWCSRRHPKMIEAVRQLRGEARRRSSVRTAGSLWSTYRGFDRHPDGQRDTGFWVV